MTEEYKKQVEEEDLPEGMKKSLIEYDKKIELKTLKDIENLSDLKQELIKHINHLENEAKKNKAVFLRNAAITGWIMNFINMEFY